MNETPFKFTSEEKEQTNYESKYLENDFADCNLRPNSHRYYARSYQLHSLKVKR